MFNNKVGPFKDIKMRKAVNAAINIEDVLIAAFSNEAFFIKDHALVKDKESGWYTDAGIEEYNLYDPELAKRLLKEAGYNGEEIVFLTNRENDSYYNSALVLQQQLEAVGINFKLTLLDTASALELKGDENAWNLTVDAFAFRPMPVQQLFLNSEYIGWPDKEPLRSVTEKDLICEFTRRSPEVFGRVSYKVLGRSTDS